MEWTTINVAIQVNKRALLVFISLYKIKLIKTTSPLRWGFCYVITYERAIIFGHLTIDSQASMFLYSTGREKDQQKNALEIFWEW